MPKIYPVPEIALGAAGRSIRIQSGQGTMNNRDRIMRVPLIDSPVARHVRAHEMAHAKYSPAEPKGPADLQMVAIQRAEDMRMNLYCRAMGLDEAMDAPILDSENLIAQIVTDPLIQKGSQLEPVTAACSAFNTGDFEPVIDAIADVDADLADRIARFIPKVWDAYGDEPQWQDALKGARKCQNFANATPEEQEQMAGGEGEASADEPEDGTEGAPGEGQPGEGQPGEGEPGEAGQPGEAGEGEPGEAGEGEPGEAVPAEDGEPREGEKSGGPAASSEVDDERDISEGSGMTDTDETPDEPEEQSVSLSDQDLDTAVDSSLERAAEMEKSNAAIPPDDRLRSAGVRIKRFALTRKLSTKKLKQKSTRASDSGRVPRHMARYATDKAVFSERGKRRIMGGTILVDCSTHMGLNQAKLSALMEMAPTAQIAAYCGCWVSKNGKLNIIAENGKRTEDGNIVPDLGCSCANAADIPVLEWLAAQEGPLFWVCKDQDGSFGMDRNAASGISKERDAIMKRAKIIRHESLEDFMRFVKRGR